MLTAAQGNLLVFPSSESSSVTDSITMTAAVAQDEADSVTSSCSLEELAIPAEEDMLSHCEYIVEKEFKQYISTQGVFC